MVKLLAGTQDEEKTGLLPSTWLVSIMNGMFVPVGWDLEEAGKDQFA